MSNRIRKSIIALALGSAAIAGLAFAQTDTASAGPSTSMAQAATATGTSQQAPGLTLKEVYDRVEAAGYTDIREIDREKGRYEVKATNAEGRAVKLYVDSVSGKIIKEKVRDDD